MCNVLHLKGRASAFRRGPFQRPVHHKDAPTGPDCSGSCHGFLTYPYSSGFLTHHELVIHAVHGYVVAGAGADALWAGRAREQPALLQAKVANPIPAANVANARSGSYIPPKRPRKRAYSGPEATGIPDRRFRRAVAARTPDEENLHASSPFAPSHVRDRQNVTIIMFHGNAGNIGHRLPIAKVLTADLGYNVFFVEYRGYGFSTGDPNEKGLNIDAQTALDYVRGRDDLRSSKIVIYGQSLGKGRGHQSCEQEPEGGRHCGSDFGKYIPEHKESDPQVRAPVL